MKKMMKIMVVVIVIAIIVLVFKNPICLGLMNVVDFIGMKANINVVDIIDLLNELYYM